MLPAIARFLGLQALARLSGRLPIAWGWSLGLLIMVVVNASPLLSLRFGSWGVSDVLVFYAIENVLIVVTTVVRLLTYCLPEPDSPFFKPPSWMTGSMFGAVLFGALAGFPTLVGTIAALSLGATHGYQGSRESWVVNLALLVLGYLGTLAVVWFGQGARKLVSSGMTMGLAPVPRILGLHLMVVFLFQLDRFDGIPWIIWTMVLAKIVWDLGIMVVELVLLLRRSRPVLIVTEPQWSTADGPLG